MKFKEWSDLNPEEMEWFTKLHGPLIARNVKEINDDFMKKLREIDGANMRRSGSLSLSGTVAFASLSLLSGNLVAKYANAFGADQNEHLLKYFCEEMEKYYRLALKRYKTRGPFEDKPDGTGVSFDAPFY